MRVLARDGVRIGPLKALNTCENGGAVAGSQSHELAALGHTGSTSGRSVPVTGDGAADVRAVARRGVRVPRLDPVVVGWRPLGGVERFLTGPGLEVVVVGMAGVHAGVEVNDGGAVAVPLAE